MDEKTQKIPLKETKKIRAALEEKTIEGLTEREWEYWKRHADREWEYWKRDDDRASAETARRDDMFEQGSKALLLMNGGGSVALLAFLQAIWPKEEMNGLAYSIVVGLVFLILGAATAGAGHFFRYKASRVHQDGSPDAGKWTYAHWAVTFISFGFFIFGMFVVVAGALCNLP